MDEEEEFYMKGELYNYRGVLPNGELTLLN